MTTYPYSGAPQIITVGNGANYNLAPGVYTITAYGGQGGGAAGSQTSGGKGGEEGGDFTLVAGENLKVFIGGSASVWGGGGGTFVLANIGGAYVPLLVAGGGGGAFYQNGGDGGVNASGSGNGGGGAGGTSSFSRGGGGGGGAGFNGAGTSGSGSTGNGGGGSDGPSYKGGTGGTYGGVKVGDGAFGGGGGGGGGDGGGGGGYTGGNGGSDTIANGAGYGGTSFHAASALNVVEVPGENPGAGFLKINVVCFATGTLIRCVRGAETLDVAVEALRVGDLAVTASGAHRPIRWIGHRTIDCQAQAQPRDVWPIRVAAHAFGDGLPSSDLFLSAGHSVRVGVMGDVLIPIGKLINGATIARHPLDAVTYWHVELDSHDVLIANGLPAESFLDCGNRDALIEQEGDYDRLKGPHTPADFCLPFVDKGAMVDAVRARLAARAAALGWMTTHDLDLHLMIDGIRVEPDVLGDIARFLFPASATNVALVSATRVPSDHADVFDHRSLGVAIHGLEVDDGLRDGVRIALDDDRIADGWHREEAAARQAHRFTTGRLALPPALWAGCRGQVVLRLHHDLQGGMRWLPPANAAANVVAMREG